MYEGIRVIANSQLKIFLSNGYSLELLFFLARDDGRYSISETYALLVSPKPQKPSFDKFIQRLLAANFIHTATGPDKRKKSLSLSDETKACMATLKIGSF